MFSVLFLVICIYRVFRPFTTKVSLQKILCENLHILFIFAFFLELQAHVHIRTCSSLIVVGQQQMIAVLCGNCQEFVVVQAVARHLTDMTPGFHVLTLSRLPIGQYFTSVFPIGRDNCPWWPHARIPSSHCTPVCPQISWTIQTRGKDKQKYDWRKQKISGYWSVWDNNFTLN